MGERNCILFEQQYVDGETEKPPNKRNNSSFLQFLLYARHHTSILRVLACLILLMA